MKHEHSEIGQNGKSLPYKTGLSSYTTVSHVCDDFNLSVTKKTEPETAEAKCNNL